MTDLSNAPNFGSMSPAEFAAWQKSTQVAPGLEFAHQQEMLASVTPRILPRREDGSLGDGDRYAPTAWGATEYDFLTPSGQLCRMRKLPIERLLEEGILDKITRLPGLTEEGPIRMGEGKPPVKAPAAGAMPTSSEMSTLMDVLEKLIPLAVVLPKVYPIPVAGSDGEIPERKPGRVYTDSIELADRIAIMERSIGGIKKLDNFRD